MYLINNAKILTMAEKDLDCGDILIKDGKIKSIGENIKADCETYDAKGKWVLPGFIDAHCHVGMWEDKIGEEGADGNETTKPITPELRALDAINPEDPAFFGGTKLRSNQRMHRPWKRKRNRRTICSYEDIWPQSRRYDYKGTVGCESRSWRKPKEGVFPAGE